MKRRVFISLAVLACVGLVCLVFSQQILWGSGAMLVRDEDPVKADIAVVLAGDEGGSRVRKGAELVRQGFVPVALVSGCARYYGLEEAPLAVALAVSKGYPGESLVAFQSRADSTVEEARNVIPELRRRGVHRLLLVTSNFHTARATRVFHRLAPDLEIHSVASADPRWNRGYWWKNRQSRKTWIQEEAKTFADILGGL